MLYQHPASTAWTALASGWIGLGAHWLAWSEETGRWWSAAAGFGPPGRSWYRPPAPELPFPLRPFDLMAAWLVPGCSGSSFASTLALLGWLPSAVTNPYGWGLPGAGMGLASPFAGWPMPWQNLSAWWLPMHEATAAVAATTAALTPDAFNPFAAYRSDGGHAVAQIVFGAPRAFAELGGVPTAWWSWPAPGRIH